MDTDNVSGETAALETDVNMQDAKCSSENSGLENGVEAYDKPAQIDTDTKQGVLIEEAYKEYRERFKKYMAVLNDFIANRHQKEIWLCEDGEDETKSVYTAKLEELKKALVGEPERSPTMMTLMTCHEIGTNGEIRPCSNRQSLDEEGKQCYSEFVFESEEILTEILIRLPTKSCFRYKAVCKCWNSLISTSYFISRYINHRRYLNNNLRAPNSFTIVFHYEVRGPAPYGLINYLYHTEAISTHPLLSKSYRNKRVNLSFLPTIGIQGRCRETIRIQASCHDLLLCSYFKTYYILNLLTSQWIVLPSHPSCFDTPIGQTYRVFPDPKAGLLCCHDQNDTNNGDGWYKFKVILAPVVCTDSFHEHDPDFNASRFTICIFCSESRQWTEFVVDWYPFRLTSFLRIPIIAHNGMLHWHAGRSVVSFDPFTVDDGDVESHPTPRLSRIMNLPDELALVTPLGLGVCRGHIQLVYRLQNNHDASPVLQVWQLKEEGVWHLVHNVLLGNSSLTKHGIACSFEFMAFHPFNQSIIFLRIPKAICEFNLRNRRYGGKFRLKLGKALSPPFECHVVPPLLHQWFPTPVPSPPSKIDAVCSPSLYVKTDIV